jgi:hypothetical protein
VSSDTVVYANTGSHSRYQKSKILPLGTARVVVLVVVVQEGSSSILQCRRLRPHSAPQAYKVSTADVRTLTTSPLTPHPSPLTPHTSHLTQHGILSSCRPHPKLCWPIPVPVEGSILLSSTPAAFNKPPGRDWLEYSCAVVEVLLSAF